MNVRLLLNMYEFRSIHVNLFHMVIQANSTANENKPFWPIYYYNRSIEFFLLIVTWGGRDCDLCVSGCFKCISCVVTVSVNVRSTPGFLTRCRSIKCYTCVLACRLWCRHYEDVLDSFRCLLWTMNIFLDITYNTEFLYCVEILFMWLKQGDWSNVWRNMCVVKVILWLTNF